MSHSKRQKIEKESSNDLADLDKEFDKLGNLETTIATFDSYPYNGKNLFEYA